jgi:hypothetical protein
VEQEQPRDDGVERLADGERARVALQEADVLEPSGRAALLRDLEQTAPPGRRPPPPSRTEAGRDHEGHVPRPVPRSSTRMSPPRPAAR